MSRISYIENFEQWQASFSFKQEVKVRFSETDMFGHLNNTITFTYFEEARMEYFKHLGLMQKWLEANDDAIIVVADLQCDYLQQVFFDEHLYVHVKTAKIGTSSVDLHYMITREDGSVCYTGRGAIVQISKATGRSLPWSEEVKAILGQFQEVE
ncbi:acyl-CoA thioesterase [Peribacillus asahii]|uniref:acyl-CoA thioesterase n=1 Tax=Peribacillus asahii TaxID=228899 RepID=UPI0037F3E131